MRLSKKSIIAIGTVGVLFTASVLYLFLTQPRLESDLIVYGPRGIKSLATALVMEFQRRYKVNASFVDYDMGSIEIANRLISEKDDPIADVILGVPEFYAKQLIDAGVLEPYAASNLSMIPEGERWDKTNNVLPMDKGYILITYNETIVVRRGLPIPNTLDDLTRSEYRGLVFYQDPTTSGTGLSFLVWIMSVKGVEQGFSFLALLEQNVRTHPSGWTSSIRALSLGEVAIGSMFNTDVGYEEVPNLKSTAVEGFVYREGIALVNGAKHPVAAKKFIEFVLGVDGQNLVSPAGYMYPVNPSASSAALSYAPKPQTEVTFNPATAGSVVEWLDRWRREIRAG